MVRVPLAYNAILGRTALNQLKAVVSTYHMKMKFPTEHGIGEVKGDQVVTRQCCMASCRTKSNETLIIEDLRDETKVERGKLAEDLLDIELYLEECQRLFEELKQYLVSPPLLTKPISGEDLFLYLSISMVAVSSVLIREDEDGVLYKKSFSFPYIKCLSPREVNYTLREVHEGICGQHLGRRNLAHKILRQGYYWPGMQKDAVSFMRRCDQCQKFAPLSHTLAIPLNILTSPIPFEMWGMDILGPFPMATGQQHFVIVAIDYFTKWTDAEPLATIIEARCEEFFWKNVVCRFGIPKVLIIDNGKQFDNSKFRSFCEDLSINLHFTSVAHPQSNGQTKNMNCSILQGLKRKLDEAKGAWVDELPKVLWRTARHLIL
ncbi:hypothetical protein RJ639_042211 [Escallonia herrerae]|uniref:Integrase catalytic domain-containing protein n=1 Tax=Escallonia herrerae TaxID=1293975 RepID=A0AA89B360_9ASTE|nr:hypothetical protein RJ639_042211 [Escallonia herrerae]